jgi:methionyl-tRNA synthetase
MKFWPADLHVVWKDIIRFHAIYWPAMLKSAWYQLPKQILTTGYFTVDWQKISKSLWNAIDPVEFCNKYWKDLLTLYILSSFNIWQDWDFDQKQAILTYNAKLANNLGNLLNRVVVLSLKLWWDTWLYIKKYRRFSWINTPFENKNYDNKIYLDNITDEIFEKLDFLNLNLKNLYINYNLKWALDNTFKFLDELNNFTTKKEPWQTLKDETKTEETRDVLYTIAEWLRQVWLNLYPFFPEKMWEMFNSLWLEWYVEKLEAGNLEELRNKQEVFKIKDKWEILFKRIDLV